MKKCTNAPYMRRSLVIYDFAPDPSEFPNIWGKFSFLFYQCTTRLARSRIHRSHTGVKVSLNWGQRGDMTHIPFKLTLTLPWGIYEFGYRSPAFHQGVRQQWAVCTVYVFCCGAAGDSAHPRTTVTYYTLHSSYKLQCCYEKMIHSLLIKEDIYAYICNPADSYLNSSPSDAD